VSNEITPAVGAGADETGRNWTTRNIVYETQLLREMLLEPPRPPRRTALAVAVLVFAVALVVAGFAVFAALA
jgi:hypothetical protein